MNERIEDQPFDDRHNTPLWPVPEWPSAPSPVDAGAHACNDGAAAPSRPGGTTSPQLSTEDTVTDLKLPEPGTRVLIIRGAFADCYGTVADQCDAGRYHDDPCGRVLVTLDGKDSTVSPLLSDIRVDAGTHGVLFENPERGRSQVYLTEFESEPRVYVSTGLVWRFVPGQELQDLGRITPDTIEALSTLDLRIIMAHLDSAAETVKAELQRRYSR